MPVPKNFLNAQLEQIFTFFPISAIKTGMLYSKELIEVLVKFLENKNTGAFLVIDPVMVATSGAPLLEKSAQASLIDNLFPLADMITPNLDEAAVFLGHTPKTLAECIDAAKSLSHNFNTPVLLKGGHLNSNDLTDVLAKPNGAIVEYKTKRSESVNSHGSGCTLASAITAELAKAAALEDAVRIAHGYLQTLFKNPVYIKNKPYIG